MDAIVLVNRIKDIGRSSVGIPVLILMMLILMVLPIPPFLLDVFFTFNITLSLVVLLGCIYVNRPLNFSVFPTILLVATLLRLTLNIASTRVVLLHGHQGPNAAGEVIHAFGEVVIGGNYTVGLIVFAILVIINFVVITKGAGRISEVSARFTLDAMPGKQMAIDADLNAGMITQDEAKQRRKEIVEEADFYGSMDGASKFVRGDAIAGLLILFINLIGGVAIGVSDYNMSFSAAMQNFALLTIGDGLVAQIPSILLSSAAAIMVTRVTSSQDIGQQALSQMFASPRPPAVVAGVMFIFGIIPGMPHLAFLLLAAVTAGASYLIYRHQQRAAVQTNPNKKSEESDKELDWSDVRPVDVIGLEIGYKLINLVGVKKDGILMSRIKGVRKKLSQEIGFLIPAVHIRDNLDLPPTRYRININGVNFGESDIQVDDFLAINPGHITAKLEGIPTKDPTFGLEAYWIKADKKEQAQTSGYTVVDASTVIATHLSYLIKENATALLGHEEVQQLLDRLGQTAPKLVESLTASSGGLSLNVIVNVLQRLLAADIPIIDFRTIAQTLADHAAKSQEPDNLTEAVRIALKRLIVQQIAGGGAELPVMVLAPELEQILHQSIKTNQEVGAGMSLGLEPSLAQSLMQQLLEYYQECQITGEAVVLLVAPEFRLPLENLFQRSVSGLHILSHHEVPENKQIRIVKRLETKVKEVVA